MSQTSEDLLWEALKDTKTNEAEIINFINENNINWNTYINGKTLLHQAIYRKLSEKVISKMIEKGAEVNARDVCGASVLLYTCQLYPNNLNTIKFLIENGADVNISNNTGVTVFIYLLQNGLMIPLLYLIENVQNINFLKTYKTLTLLQWSKQCQKWRIEDENNYYQAEIFIFKRIFYDLWEMISLEFTLFIQWVPKEVFNDIYMLLVKK